MHLSDLHTSDKPVSTAKLFEANEGTVISLQILANEQLKEHITKVPALLLCVSGEATFENEKGESIPLSAGSYVHIEAFVKHWINAKTTCFLVLTK